MPPHTTTPALHAPTTSDPTVVQITDEEFREPDAARTAARLRRLADEAGPRGLWLDLAGVGFLASTGLGQLVALHKRVAAVGGRLTLANVRPLVHEAFEITRLTLLLDVRRAEGDAEAA
jgi:anti-anti-sigma factor